jgi:glycosyltransferase involved in cell wall biosynthesis
MRIVNWQISISSHQFYLWKAVQELIDEEFVLVFDKLNDCSEYKNISADQLKTLGAVIHLKGSKIRAGYSLINRYPDAVHVFSGFRNAWYFFPLILHAIARNCKVAIMNEPYSTSPAGYMREEPDWWSHLKVFIRPFLYRSMARLISISVKEVQPCILPLSLLAREQLRRAGFNEEIMFPFGYFVPKSPASIIKQDRQHQKRCLVFVGSLLKRKGLDVAIQAVESLHRSGYSVTLDIYGPGQPEHFISAETDCVRYRGIIPPSNVQATISKYDMLILPSRHDGWGVVVNEALLQGIPVVVSDRVGAKCLVENSGAGIVFVSEDSADLAHKLEELILEPSRLDGMHHRASDVGQAISPEAGAQYLMDVFQYHFYHHGQRPVALWSSMK